jgi:hypothetical protein
LIIGITNNGGNADSTTLNVSLTGLQLVSSKVDRGSGCTSDGGPASCFLDFFPGGLSATEELDVRVTSLPAAASASVSSFPAGTSTTGTWSTAPSTSATGLPPSAAPPGPIRTPEAAKSPLTDVTVPGFIVVRGKKPEMPVSVRVTKTVTLELRLLDHKGRLLASWSRIAKPGTAKLELALPPRARTPGRYTLRITTDGHAREVSVTLRAPSA